MLNQLSFKFQFILIFASKVLRVSISNSLQISIRMSSVRQVETQFINFIQSYKNLFNTTYSTLENQPNLPADSTESIQQKQNLVNDLYQNYRQVINSIDALQQINQEELQKKHLIEKHNQDEDSDKDSMIHILNQSSGCNLGSAGNQEQKYKKYESQICQKHDKAVLRYKTAIRTADIWRENLYKYINANLPSGNH